MNFDSSTVGSKRSFSDCGEDRDSQMSRSSQQQRWDAGPLRPSNSIEMTQSNVMNSYPSLPNSNALMSFNCSPAAMLISQYLTNPYLQAQLLASNSLAPQFSTQLPSSLVSNLPPANIYSNMPNNYGNVGSFPLLYPNLIAPMPGAGQVVDPDLMKMQLQQAAAFNPSIMSLVELQTAAMAQLTSGISPSQYCHVTPLPAHSAGNNVTPSLNSQQIGDDDSSFNDRSQKCRIRWTKHMDELLLEGFELYKDYKVGMWKKVAQYVSAHLTVKDPTPNDLENCQLIVTNHQCGERYKHHLHPDIQSRNSGPWSEEEIQRLAQLVAENQVVVDGVTSLGRSKTQVNWIKVSDALNRNYRDCQHKWTAVSKSSLKKGVFTKEEEDLIMATVEQHGDCGATWNLLESELGRKRRSIQDKYNYLKKRTKKFVGIKY